ncbi:hypothetical protein MPL3365_140013 [Mesorhizobium plurifarium]|uniref:Uncharacterized protein n=1 Tax=Mesorhizobium plurifarium TaxID=69974 RepID=A0A090FXB5_MESPL|nr:hypothetical protein MPL3365_140013 [Mesorhizobium plurifarium]
MRVGLRLLHRHRTWDFRWIIEVSFTYAMAQHYAIGYISLIMLS